MIPSDKAMIFLPKEKPYTPKIDGWFVPEARMQDFLERGWVTNKTTVK